MTIHPFSFWTLPIFAAALLPLSLAADEGDHDKEMALIREIHARIVENQASPEKEKKADNENDKTDSISIPGTKVSFEMVRVPMGTFLMGSPKDEKGRDPDEGPQFRAEISAFWMGKLPVTWDEFELFMYPDRTGPIKETGAVSGEWLDAVSHPTAPYVDMSFGMGKKGYPAIGITHQAASKYCQWLSAKTGQFYRLPTEAEWEYAARAGTTTAYTFGNDPANLDEFAWSEKNTDFTSQPVGKKEPNAWGLHDMHGSVWEWTLDQYFTDRYASYAGKDLVVNPWAKPTKEYPRVVRGGSWNDAPEKLRSANRRASDPDWKMLDPQLPKSIWYHTNAPWLGFRIVRPGEVPSPEEMYEYWNL